MTPDQNTFKAIALFALEPTPANGETLKSELTTLAHFYNIPLKKVGRLPFKSAAIDFLKNEQGYLNTINKLISSI